MNMVKRFSAKGKTRGGMGASRRIGVLVKALLLPVLDFFAGLWAPASSSCFPTGLVGGLTWEFRQKQDPGAIAIELKSKERDIVLPNGLTDSLGIKLLELGSGQPMIENTRFYQLEEDAQRERKKIIYRSYVTWLRKRCAKLRKICNWLFLLDWAQIIEPGESHAM